MSGVIFALIVASVLRKLARMRVWFCGVTLVDARQECLRQRQLRFAERAGELAGRLGDQRHQFHADRSAAHGNGVPQVYGFTGTATAARSGQT